MMIFHLTDGLTINRFSFLSFDSYGRLHLESSIRIIYDSQFLEYVFQQHKPVCITIIARAHLKEQTGITFRDHEGKCGRGDATRSYPPKRISRKVRDVVHHIQRFPSFYRDSCDSCSLRSFSAVETRRINDEAVFVYLTQFVALFRAAAR